MWELSGTSNYEHKGVKTQYTSPSSPDGFGTNQIRELERPGIEYLLFILRFK